MLAHSPDRGTGHLTLHEAAHWLRQRGRGARPRSAPGEMRDYPTSTKREALQRGEVRAPVQSIGGAE